MFERNHTSLSCGREINARISYKLSAILTSELAHDDKEKPICSYAWRTRDENEATNGTQYDEVINRKQVENAKAKMISRDTCAKKHRFKVGDRVAVM